MQFSHFDQDGKAIMVDVGAKDNTKRQAIARGSVTMSPECFQMVKEGSHKKGDVLNVARIAGIMATKKTQELIPLCHNIMITKAEIDFEYDAKTPTIHSFCTVETYGKTGVEMEALTGVNIALLTIYDMCKAVDRSMELHDIYVVRKEGGKSGLYEHEEKE